MRYPRLGNLAAVLAILGGLSACGGNASRVDVEAASEVDTAVDGGRRIDQTRGQGSTIWDLFAPDTSDQTVAVNRYLWNASLDVLSFLPVEEVDPFTGIIVMGYGTPPGGARAYRATVYITDPALEARALRVALQSRNGPVAAGTSRAVEDAILARARQMRIADSQF